MWQDYTFWIVVMLVLFRVVDTAVCIKKLTQWVLDTKNFTIARRIAYFIEEKKIEYLKRRVV